MNGPLVQLVGEVSGPAEGDGQPVEIEAGVLLYSPGTESVKGLLLKEEVEVYSVWELVAAIVGQEPFCAEVRVGADPDAVLGLDGRLEWYGGIQGQSHRQALVTL
jgi:hypothetical protein